MLSAYAQSLLVFLGINGLMALSVYLPSSAGLISLGQGGFMAIGAYCAALLTGAGVPFAVALAAGALLAAIIGVLVAAPAVRIRGIYLIIATLGFGEIVRVIFVNLDFAGGASGLSGIQPLTTLTWVAALCLAVVVVLWRLRTTALGRAIVAVHEDETAAQAMGVNLLLTKLAAFGGGAFIAGLAGGLYAHYALFIDPTQFGFERSAEAFLYVVLGGTRNPLGPLIGAAVVTLLPEYLRFLQDWRMSFFAVLLIGCAIWRPGGLIPAPTARESHL
jgi:branched-chain amino acid transport system permease protein